MSLPPTLLVRRWPERRPVVLTAAAVGAVAIVLAGGPGERGLGALYVLPVLLAALELGLVPGLAAAAVAAGISLADGAIAPAAVALAVGAIAGRFSNQMRALHAREHGLGRLLAAQEDERDRTAETLHEELAQALAGILLGLRMLRRQGSLDEPTLNELHDQVMSALTDVRELAGALRPTSLAHLGLGPALEALRESCTDLTLEANGIPDPVPEPLRTGLYRLIESAVGAATPGEPVRVALCGTDEQLNVVIDAELGEASEPVAAARARVSLLEGSLGVEPLPDRRTRLRVRLPVRGELLSARGH